MALVLVCAAPIYSEVATSAGLQSDLAASQRAEIDVQSLAYRISSPAVEQATQSLNSEMQTHLGSYLLAPQFSARAEFLDIQQSAEKMNLIGVSPGQVASHIKILEGRIPPISTTTVEGAITPETAIALHLALGSTLVVNVTFHSQTHKPLSFDIPLHISGIFTQNDASAAYWLGASFEPSPLSNSSTIFGALISNETLLHQFAQFSQSPLLRDQVLSNPVHPAWYYPLDISRFFIIDV